MEMCEVQARSWRASGARPWWGLLVLAVVFVSAGCAVGQTFGALGDAGFSVSSVSTNNSGGSTTVQVVADSPPGVPHQVAVEQAQRVLWQTQRSRVDRIELTLDGNDTTATREQLTARFGPRDPALDESHVDQVLLVGIFAAVGLVVIAVVTVAVVVTVRRRRRWRAGGVGLDPLWGITALLGPRAGQFVLDYLVWWLPTVAGMFLVVTLGVSTAFSEAGGFPVLFLALSAVWMLLSIAWGWYTYAYWPARHLDQTFGMRLVGLRVAALDGSPVGVGRHTVRWLLLAVEIGFGGLVALLALSTSTRHQRLGDMATGTIVVRAQPQPAPPCQRP